MCGHFGMAGRGITATDLKVFKQLGIVTQLRGLDGAGVVVDKVLGYEYDGYPHTMKSEHDFCDLWAQDNYELSTTLPDVFIGHCRAATIGKVTLENVHPFSKGDWTIAHNGTVFAQEYNMDPKKTDSEQLIEAIAEDGAKVALERLDWWDAYALVGVNHKEKTLMFARNSERGLYFGISFDRDVIWWSSEKKILEFVLDRVGAGRRTISQFSTDKVFTLGVDAIEAGVEELFYIENVDHYKKWTEVKKNSGKKDENLTDVLLNDAGKRNDEYCVMCKSKLTNSDFTWGLYSEYYSGVICEQCAYMGKNYA